MNATQPAAVRYGFELVATHDIAELRTRAERWRHQRTGADLLSLINEDENKCFGITFRTPPADSTGLPHILEHSVLGGSEKYPVKEPFVELVKGSLRTFVNAMTYPDHTCYPVASQNLQDFYNLVDVYLDAVFHPLITPHHLAQEGWHYELAGDPPELTRCGVVFNEMKGVYSSPEALLWRHTELSLFPDATYGHDSGGDPKVIPALTYEQFRAFYERFYHPSNALIFFCGDDPPEERLRKMDACLAGYSRQDVRAGVALQPPFESPRRVTAPYRVDPGADAGRKAMAQVNWALPVVTDQTELMLLGVMFHALLDTPASPLRKALLDSQLGEMVLGGSSPHTRQMMFSAGLKGIADADAGRVETLVLDTLRRLVAEGFDPAMIEAGVNTLEFGLRENNTGSFPRGLALMIRALLSWVYGDDPLPALAYAAPLAAAKQRLAQDAACLQGLLQRYLLDNPHRTTVVLVPDPALQRREEEEERADLERARLAMGEDELRRIAEEAAELKRRQEAPDSPEALALIPVLRLQDLDPRNKRLPLEAGTAADAQLLRHDLFTNEIVYLDLGLDLSALPPARLPYLGLFGSLLLEMGTRREDYVKLAQRIGAKTGGIWTELFTSSVTGGGPPAAYLFLRAKATAARAAELLDILRDVLLDARLEDRDRFRQILLEARAGREAALVPSGHAVVAARLRSGFNTADWLAEQMNGISQLFFLRALTQRIESDWPGVQAELEEVRRLLLNRAAWVVNVTVDDANWRRIQPRLEEFLAAMPAGKSQAQGWAPEWDRADEGLTMPTRVNYVGQGFNLYDFGYRLHGSIYVIANFVRTTWLWDRVRLQGGAYGAFCGFDKLSGLFTFTSYRDPRLLETLDVYEATPEFLRRVELSEIERVKSIIGAVGAMDAHLLPDAKGYTSMVRHLTGDTPEKRQKLREEVLGTQVSDFRALADVLAAARGKARVVVLGPEDALRAASESLARPLRLLKLL